MDRAPGTYGTILKSRIVMSLESQKRGERLVQKTYLRKKIPENFPNLVKKFLDSRSSANPNRINLKKTMSIDIIIKLLKNKNNILKIPEKTTCYIHVINLNDPDYSLKGQKTEQHFKSTETKELSAYNSISSKHIL